VIKGAPNEACYFNNRISNAQAIFLMEEGRCMNCHKPMTGDGSCRDSRVADGRGKMLCARKGKGYAIRHADFQNRAPAWDK
jgi:hypothetical protein